jgi:hypothetical protein
MRWFEVLPVQSYVMLTFVMHITVEQHVLDDQLVQPTSFASVSASPSESSHLVSAWASSGSSNAASSIARQCLKALSCL